MYCSRLLIHPKKVLTLAGIEHESPRVAVGSADHSATRHSIFKKYFIICKSDNAHLTRASLCSVIFQISWQIVPYAIIMMVDGSTRTRTSI